MKRLNQNSAFKWLLDFRSDDHSRKHITCIVNNKKYQGFKVMVEGIFSVSYVDAFMELCHTLCLQKCRGHPYVFIEVGLRGPLSLALF